MSNTQTQGFFFNPPLKNNFWGHIFSELYKDKIFDPFLPSKKEGTLCLEVGGNVGLVTYFFSQFFEKTFVLEPSMQHFDILVKMLDFNKITNVIPIPKALYLENGKFPFGGPKDNTTMRSLHMSTWDQGKWDEEVETITFDKLFEDEKIEHVDLLKADIEGSEIELLSGEGFKIVAPKIDTIVVESHKWSGRHPNQLLEALKNNNFEVSTMPSSAEIVVGRRKRG